MLYKAGVAHDGLQAGIVYDLEPEDIEARQGAIDAGLLVSVDDTYPVLNGVEDIPEREPEPALIQADRALLDQA